MTPGVFFDPTSYTVNEDAGVAILTVRTNVPGGPVDGAVQFYTEDGSATGMLLHHRGLGNTSSIIVFQSKAILNTRTYGLASVKCEK